MGKRRRKKSSESDTEKPQCKQRVRYGGNRRQRQNKGRDLDLSISEVLSEANDILFSAKGDFSETGGSLSETDSETETTHCSLREYNSAQNCTIDIDKMAQSQPKKPEDLSDSEKLNFLVHGMENLQKSQDTLKKMVESKIDRLRNELKSDIDTKIKVLKDDISLAESRESTRIDEMLTTIQSLSSRMDNIEHLNGNAAMGHADNSGETDNGQAGERRVNDQGQGWYRPGRLDDTELSVVVTGVDSAPNEDLMVKAQDIIDALDNNVSAKVSISGVRRFRSRIPDRPGLLKITFQNIEQKILVLRNKMSLKEKDGFKRIYIKSCKSHAERLIELNARALLRRMPDGNNYRVDASGRIQPRERPGRQQEPTQDIPAEADH